MKSLPDILPIFPLYGVLLLPGGKLPLNVFEPRYIAMFDHALKTDRLIGVIQPRQQDEEAIFSVGCAGKIIEFSEMPDGRYEVVLCGVSRFEVEQEIADSHPFRQVQPNWEGFQADLEDNSGCLGLERDKLKTLLRLYFEREGMGCDWDRVDGASDGKLMTCLSMVCPFGALEKQALMEEKCCKERSKLFMTLLEMDVHKA